METNERLVPVGTLARRLHVPGKWLVEEADAGRIPALRAGSRYLFDEDAVRRVLLSRAGPRGPQKEFQESRGQGDRACPSGGMKNTNPHLDTVRRAALPEILFPSDVALALNLSESEAARTVKAGACGPYFSVGGRPAVLRTEFLAALSRRATEPGGGKEVTPASAGHQPCGPGALKPRT